MVTLSRYNPATGALDSLVSDVVDVRWVSEDDDTVLGSTRFSRWSYACSKAIDEFLALAYHQQYGLPVVIVRLFNTVGPRQTGRYGMVIPRFVERALSNQPIQKCGSTAGREFLSYEQAYGRAFDDMKRRVPCLDRINQAIGFKPQYTLDQTLQRIIDEMKSS